MNHQQTESESESLLRYGHSKDKRPDLLQYRQLLATLDPAGIPLVSATLAGNGADDPVYWPTWQEQVTRIHLQLQFQQQSAAIEQAEQLAGWRLYVTNAPTTRLTLPQAVTYYRDEWLLERGFHRFKRGRLPALPIYFQNQDRIAGLMFLLTIALRVFTLIEFVVRQALQNTQQSLTGLYDGNPKRATARPSTEQLLKAFCHLTLDFLPNSRLFITPLSELQRQILSLMKMPESLYQLPLRQRKT